MLVDNKNRQREEGCSYAQKEKIDKFMRQVKWRNVFLDAGWVNPCKAIRDETEKQGLLRILFAGKLHQHHTSIHDGDLFATLQTEASRMTIENPKGPKERKKGPIDGGHWKALEVEKIQR